MQLKKWNYFLNFLLIHFLRILLSFLNRLGVYLVKLAKKFGSLIPFFLIPKYTHLLPIKNIFLLRIVIGNTYLNRMKLSDKKIIFQGIPGHPKISHIKTLISWKFLYLLKINFRRKKLLNPFCFACTLGLLPYLSTNLNEYS